MADCGVSNGWHEEMWDLGTGVEHGVDGRCSESCHLFIVLIKSQLGHLGQKSPTWCLLWGACRNMRGSGESQHVWLALYH